MGLNESLGLRPPRMSLINLATGVGLDVQFNPTEFSEKLGVNYARQVVPGLGYAVLQYVNTNNLTWSMEIYYTASPGPDALEQLKRARRWLHSVCYPRNANSVGSGGAPRLLFVWPDVFAMTCVLTEHAGKFTRFNAAGQPVQYTATVTFEDARDTRILSEEVFQVGTQRSSNGLPANVDIGEL